MSCFERWIVLTREVLSPKTWKEKGEASGQCSNISITSGTIQPSCSVEWKVLVCPLLLSFETEIRMLRSRIGDNLTDLKRFITCLCSLRKFPSFGFFFCVFVSFLLLAWKQDMEVDIYVLFRPHFSYIWGYFIVQKQLSFIRPG